ncbi:MAG: HPr family phosphocarrier protein [Chloroflexi bacterium]|nr:HPr family phosphocarrier protein [Chloroflexota bacterium]
MSNPNVEGNLTGDAAQRKEVSLVIKHPAGLHARPASLFVQMARKYTSGSHTKVKIRNDTMHRGPVDASSILSVLTLGVQQGHAITILAEGPDAVASLQALQQLCDSNFGEEIPAV